MTIRVPSDFAASIRHKRLLGLAILSITSFVLAIFDHPEFAYAGCPLIIYMFIILATYRLPLMYRLGSRGIYLTTEIPLLALPISLAMNFWVSWLFDRVKTVKHTHFQDHPALLIITRFNPRGTLLPIDRSDAESVAVFLNSTGSETSANAFS